jgi:hypothetical protein
MQCMTVLWVDMLGTQSLTDHMRYLFAWPGMKRQIKEYVQNCQVCLQAKPKRVRYPGLLQLLSTPSEACEMASMGFIEGLPHSGKYNCKS